MRDLRIERSACEAGFTLVEVLIALSLLSLLVVLMLSVLRFGTAAWKSGAERAESVDRILVVQNHLRHLIERIYPFYVSTGTGQGRVEFEGEPDALGFLAPTTMALGGRGRSRYRVFMAQRSGQTNLTLSVVEELAVRADAAAERILLNGVRSLSLSYYGRTSFQEPAAWHDEWKQQPRLPQAIRVRVAFAPGDTRHWPDLIVTPRISVDVGCTFDALTKQCRGR